MPNEPEEELDTLQAVEAGDVLTYNGRVEPVVVKEVEHDVIAERCGAAVSHRVTCDGSRGGEIVLCELECGEVRCARGCDTDTRPLTSVCRRCSQEASESTVQ